MSKVHNPIRRVRNRQQHLIEGKQSIPIDSAESIMSIQLMLTFVSATQVLTEDFGFNAEQILKFQELLQLRMEINRIKK